MKRIEINGVLTVGELAFCGDLPLPQKKCVSISDVQWFICHYKNGRFEIVFQPTNNESLDYCIDQHRLLYLDFECFCFNLTSKIERI